MKGFITTTDAPSRKPLPLAAQCGTCQLFKGCKSPKMPVDGKGRKKILIIAEAPGREEDEQGRPLIGPSGKLLWDTMAKAGFERDDCWITNSIICRPPENKMPPRAIDYCRPNVVKAIEELKPRVILLLGASAVKSVLGWLWREDVGLASRWDGWAIPHQGLRAWICPTWHPAYIMRMETGDSGKDRGAGTDVGKLFFEKHVAAACDLWRERPWKQKPDWERWVKNVLDPDEAAIMICNRITEKPVAFDLETTSLKPDSSNAEIYCCSVSDGQDSIAFPWHGKAIDAMKELLVSDTPKIGFNAKFESRWIKAKLGITVRNWVWDGMIAAHVLDNRDSICSLKWQAFTRLGFGPYDDEVRPFLKAKGSNERNRIREAPLEKVLHYCGIDAMLEHRLWQLQQKEFA